MSDEKNKPQPKKPVGDPAPKPDPKKPAPVNQAQDQAKEQTQSPGNPLADRGDGPREATGPGHESPGTTGQPAGRAPGNPTGTTNVNEAPRAPEDPRNAGAANPGQDPHPQPHPASGHSRVD